MRFVPSSCVSHEVRTWQPGPGCSSSLQSAAASRTWFTPLIHATDAVLSPNLCTQIEPSNTVPHEVPALQAFLAQQPRLARGSHPVSKPRMGSRLAVMSSTQFMSRKCVQHVVRTQKSSLASNLRPAAASNMRFTHHSQATRAVHASQPSHAYGSHP